MSGMYGISGASFFNTYFGSSGNSGSYSGTGSVFSQSSSVNLSDFSMIRNGTYSKLMKSYYKNVDTSSEKSKLTKNKDASDVKSLTLTRNDAQTLYKAASAMNNSSLYSASSKDGSYDYDTLYKKASDFAKAYNDLHDSFEDIDSTSVLNVGINMTGNTSANKGLLGKVGITVNADNTLKIDEDKFKSASMNDLKTLFTGRSSYGDKIKNYASSAYSIASSNVAASTVTGSAYTMSGAYALSAITTYSGII